MNSANRVRASSFFFSSFDVALAVVSMFRSFSRCRLPSHSVFASSGIPILVRSNSAMMAYKALCSCTCCALSSLFIPTRSITNPFFISSFLIDNDTFTVCVMVINDASEDPHKEEIPKRNTFQSSILDGSPKRGAFQSSILDGSPKRGAFHCSILDGSPKRGAFYCSILDGSPKRDAFHCSILGGSPKRGAFHCSILDGAFALVALDRSNSDRACHLTQVQVIQPIPIAPTPIISKRCLRPLS